MRVFLLFGGILALAIVGYFIFSSSPENRPKISATPTPQAEESTEAKAAFAIFTNGTFRIFTASMYHNRSDDVFIEASNPNLIRIKKNGITWDDFFKTLPMNLTRDCLTTGDGQTFCTKANQTLKFYLNNQLDPSVLDRTINAGDQLLVSYGSENDKQIKKQLEQVPIIK